MKLDPVIVCEDGSILEYVNPTDHGVYLLFKIKVQRGIKGKSKSKVDELLIVGVPWSKVDKVLAKYGLRVEKL